MKTVFARYLFCTFVVLIPCAFAADDEGLDGGLPPGGVSGGCHTENEVSVNSGQLVAQGGPAAQIVMASDIAGFCKDAQIPLKQGDGEKTDADRCLDDPDNQRMNAVNFSLQNMQRSLRFFQKQSNMSPAELPEINVSVDRSPVKTDRVVSWPLQICPSEDIRLLGYTKNSFLYGSDAEIPVHPWFNMETAGDMNVNSWGFHNLDEAESYLKTGVVPGPKVENYIQDVEEKYSGDGFRDYETDSRHEVSYDFANSQAVRDLVCASETLLHFANCAKYIGSILDDFRPHNNNTAIPLFKKIFTHPEYIEGAKKAALRIMDRIRNGERPPNGSLLDDVRNGYLEAGLPKKQADDLAWDLLAAIATGGQGVAWHVMPYPAGRAYFPLKVAMEIIATGAPVLDSRGISSRHPYSLPKEFSTTCDYGKFYHFWLTAYIARKFASNGGDAVAAETAARLADKGYQMLANTGFGRKATNAFTTDTFSQSNNNIRIDLAFSSAGALYGANQGSGKKSSALDVDRGLAALIRNATIQPPLDEASANAEWNGWHGVSGYQRWNSIFAPDSATEVFHAE